MMGLLKLTAAGVCTVSLIFTGVSTTATAATKTTQTKQESILGDYLKGVDKDTYKFLTDLATEINDYICGNNKALDEFKKNPSVKNAKKLAKEMERRAESFADVMEAVSEAYGELQAKNGENFGEKFDKDTAESITKLVLEILGYSAK